jgi:hypothetical protein
MPLINVTHRMTTVFSLIRAGWHTPERNAMTACFLAFVALVFAALWLAGLVQYACDQIVTAWREAWSRLK